MIELLVGNIASGKSTYAKQKAADECIVINDDAIVSMVHGNEPTFYKVRLKTLYKSIENHIVYTAIAMGKDVIIDKGVCVKLDSRRRWIEVARSLDTKIQATVFPFEDCSQHATRRNLHDSRGYDYGYWYKIAKFFELQYIPPSYLEGFDKIINLSIEDIL